MASPLWKVRIYIIFVQEKTLLSPLGKRTKQASASLEPYAVFLHWSPAGNNWRWTLTQRQQRADLGQHEPQKMKIETTSEYF